MDLSKLGTHHPCLAAGVYIPRRLHSQFVVEASLPVVPVPRNLFIFYTYFGFYILLIDSPRSRLVWIPGLPRVANLLLRKEVPVQQKLVGGPVQTRYGSYHITR